MQLFLFSCKIPEDMQYSKALMHYIKLLHITYYYKHNTKIYLQYNYFFVSSNFK